MDPFLGEIFLFAGNFAPRGWAFCHGQLLPISQNTALFSLLGTIYGGDGRTTFGLPDLRGRTPVHSGTGPGLPTLKLGQKFGSNTNTLTSTNIPDVNIKIGASSEDASSDEPSGKVFAVAGSNAYSSTVDETMLAGSIKGAASSPVNNMQPYLGLNFIIAVQGQFPSRS